MGNLVDISGKTFGRWRVVGRAGINQQGKSTWTCVCECGREVVVTGNNLTSGASQSCGCVLRSGYGRHGMTGTLIHKIWTHLRIRARRGTRVHPVWRDSIDTFARDVGERPGASYRLMRIKPKLGWVPGNISWRKVNREDVDISGRVMGGVRVESLSPQRGPQGERRWICTCLTCGKPTLLLHTVVLCRPPKGCVCTRIAAMQAGLEKRRRRNAKGA